MNLEITPEMLRDASRRAGARMAELRAEHRMTREQLAAAITELQVGSWHPQTVLRVEKGERELRLGEAAGLAYIFNVDAAEFIARFEPEVSQLARDMTNAALDVLRAALPAAIAEAVALAQREAAQALAASGSREAVGR